MNKRILIIGSGISAARFSRILKRHNYQVGIFQHRKKLKGITGTFKVYDLNGDFGAVVVASNTSSHSYYINKLIEIGMPFLVEKPFSDNLNGIKSLINKINRKKIIVRCGLNLRYLPIVDYISSLLVEKKLGEILWSRLSSGSYLPDWRNSNYANFYSANFEKGGGVSLDLIHEIDLAFKFFPKLKLEVLTKQKMSSLKISTEDFAVFYQKKSPFVEISLDYLNHNKSRRYVIVGKKGSIDCDVVGNRCQINLLGKSEILTNKNLFDISKTYELEILDFLNLVNENNFSNVDERLLGIDALRVAVDGRLNV